LQLHSDEGPRSATSALTSVALSLAQAWAGMQAVARIVARLVDLDLPDLEHVPRVQPRLGRRPRRPRYRSDPARRPAPATATRLATDRGALQHSVHPDRFPVVELNRAIAVAELDGPEAGLAILNGLDLDHYRYFHSARAELLRRARRDDEARHAYRRALELSQTDAERRSLNDQLTQLSPG
jgi:hypothetical protein